MVLAPFNISNMSDTLAAIFGVGVLPPIPPLEAFDLHWIHIRW